MRSHLLMTAVAAVAAAAACGAPALAQFDLESAVVESTDLGDGLHLLTGAGGNIALLVGPDGAMMVDDQFNELADRIAAKIGELADGESGRVRFVVNTHYHFDHAGGNEAWNDRGATIVAHDNVRKRLSNPQPNVLSGELSDAEPPGAWPVVTFPEAVTFHMNGQTIHVVHTPPAHTDGDSAVYFEEADVLHTGDMFIRGGFPLIDGYANGSLDGFVAAQTMAIDHINADTRIIPGHGPISTLADLTASRDKLAQFRDILAPLAATDLPVEDIVANRPLDGHDEGYAGGFISTDDFITAAVTAMRRGAAE
jgi:glyoxylase-like metal-dependent hydrolase (beta-lactamase superfamily II)